MPAWPGTGSGYMRHDAIYKRSAPNVGAQTYPTNYEDNTNKHVIWHMIDHRYYGAGGYKKNNQNLQLFDTYDLNVQQRYLGVSASILTIPYFRAGEQIRPGSVTIDAVVNSIPLNLRDDGNGNLYDLSIDTEDFASASRCQFYLDFNDFFRNYEYGHYTSRLNTGTVLYRLRTIENEARFQNLRTDRIRSSDTNIGYFGDFTSGSRIRIPHNEIYNDIDNCSDWTISFIYNPYAPAETTNLPLISKAGIFRSIVLDEATGTHIYEDATFTMPNITGSYSKIVTPFVIGVESDNYSASIHFHSSDGTSELHISSSFEDITSGSIHHIAIRNSGSNCEILIDSNQSGTSGSLPGDFVVNSSDIVIGDFINGEHVWGNTPAAVSNQLGEIRIYDYAVSDNQLSSLFNLYPYGGTWLQTNVVGNIFYRNGQIVVSHPSDRYIESDNTEVSSSGLFYNDFTASYDSTHTIYENEILVRIPRDEFNVTVNPTATYSSNDKNCAQDNLLPGRYRKEGFVNGTLKPYITTVGLYNNDNELVAVAKLAQPIQKRNDVDMNIIVRFDF